MACAPRSRSAPARSAAAPVTVTTTNIPGSLAFSFAADAATLGTLDRWREDFAYAIAASAQATATTIVCPATTNVIWRITAGFYFPIQPLLDPVVAIDDFIRSDAGQPVGGEIGRAHV